VHIIDGGVPSALLLEVLTAQGVGTAVRSGVSARSPKKARTASSENAPGSP